MGREMETLRDRLHKVHIALTRLYHHNSESENHPLNVNAREALGILEDVMFKEKWTNNPTTKED